MDEFIENIKILINVLGHNVFEEIRKIKSRKQQEQETFYIKAARGANANGEPISDGFIVLKGSNISISTVPSISQNFNRLRDKLIKDGIIGQFEGIMKFFEDYVFSSPSTAAAAVMGRNANGLTEWKLKDGTKLKDFETQN